MSQPILPPEQTATATTVAVPVMLARFSSHLSRHGLAYAVAWLIVDATGTWAALTGAAAGVCG